MTGPRNPAASPPVPQSSPEERKHNGPLLRRQLQLLHSLSSHSFASCERSSGMHPFPFDGPKVDVATSAGVVVLACSRTRPARGRAVFREPPRKMDHTHECLFAFGVLPLAIADCFLTLC